MDGPGLHWLMLIPVLPIVMLLFSFWYFTCCQCSGTKKSGTCGGETTANTHSLAQCHRYLVEAKTG